MKQPILFAAALTCVLSQAQAAGGSIPTALQTPAGEKVVLEAHATGVQIYTCGAGADGKPQWTLKGPDADLHDHKGAVVGHHSAGPTWKYKDGSEVTGKVAARVDSPDGQSIPWLLLNAAGHSGAGLFAKVTSIQRLHTKGGQPSASSVCDSSKTGSETRSEYSANYYFYAP